MITFKKIWFGVLIKATAALLGLVSLVVALAFTVPGLLGFTSAFSGYFFGSENAEGHEFWTTKQFWYAVLAFVLWLITLTACLAPVIAAGVVLRNPISSSSGSQTVIKVGFGLSLFSIPWWVWALGFLVHSSPGNLNNAVFSMVCIGNIFAAFVFYQRLRRVD